LFGEIADGEMILNDAGKMVENEWKNLKNRFQNIELHEFIVMPNHFHGILQIVGATLVVAQNNNMVAQNDMIAPNNNGATNKKATTRVAPTRVAPTTVGDIIGAFQSIVTVNYIRAVKNFGWQSFDKKLWQRNYWEHIIRNEKSYSNIVNYIINNPEKWETDTLYNNSFNQRLRP
jgi:REP element-mobilizing transposase RayT